jgi:ferrochelatase
MSRKGVLLVNLGSPDSTSVSDVRRYLREFLMDERVLDAPWPIRFFVVHCLILPFRPAKTAKAYRKVWQQDGSPLVSISRKVHSLIKARMPMPVELAMRYQNPSILSGVEKLLAQGIDELVLVPLYPHYAQSTTETVEVKTREALNRLAPQMKMTMVPPFFDHAEYIEAMAESMSDYLHKPWDHLLFSFHGLPERHMRKADPTGKHCLASPDCCEKPSLAHKTCYRAQAFQSVKAIANKLQLDPSKYSISFQSRLGRDPWLKPYTDFEFPRLVENGVRDLLVVCPSFVSDCLETLEEIGMRGQETFQQAGGRQLTLIPCLNEHPRWIDCLQKLILFP